MPDFKESDDAELDRFVKGSTDFMGNFMKETIKGVIERVLDEVQIYPSCFAPVKKKTPCGEDALEIAIMRVEEGEFYGELIKTIGLTDIIERCIESTEDYASEAELDDVDNVNKEFTKLARINETLKMLSAKIDASLAAHKSK
jgi:hypothetical protein